MPFAPHWHIPTPWPDPLPGKRQPPPLRPPPPTPPPPRRAFPAVGARHGPQIGKILPPGILRALRHSAASRVVDRAGRSVLVIEDFPTGLLRGGVEDRAEVFHPLEHLVLHSRHDIVVRVARGGDPQQGIGPDRHGEGGERLGKARGGRLARHSGPPALPPS